MEKSQLLLERIDDYVLGNLSGTELQDFEARLQTDSDLRYEVKQQQLIRKALSDKESMGFRKLLMAIDEKLTVDSETPIIKMTKDMSTSNKSSWKFLKIASVFVVLIGLTCAIWFWPKNDINLFNDYYTPYPAKDLTRGENTKSSTTDDKLLTFYRKGKYDQTISLLEDKLKNNPSDERLKIYLGNSYLNTDQEEKALLLFETFGNNSSYFYDAQWFAALTYIKTNTPEKAIPILTKLSENINLYRNKALEILNKLK